MCLLHPPEARGETARPLPRMHYAVTALPWLSSVRTFAFLILSPDENLFFFLLYKDESKKVMSFNYTKCLPCPYARPTSRDTCFHCFKFRRIMTLMDVMGAAFTSTQLVLGEKGKAHHFTTLWESKLKHQPAREMGRRSVHDQNSGLARGCFRCEYLCIVFIRE